MNTTPGSLPKTFSITAIVLCSAYAYAWALSCLPASGLDPWIIVAFINTALAVLVLWLWKIDAEPLSPVPQRIAAWSLGLWVILGSSLLIYFSTYISKETHDHGYTLYDFLALCLWIPVVEEIVFRRFLSQWIGLRVQGLWAIYVSGLAFALAHTSPPLHPWPPLGPFLLGCACTWVYRATGRTLAPIILHAACNASAVMFAVYAPSWLDHLSLLYQKL
ncbi:MAG: CPBP family intramembrane metalloprotease [Chitinophagaceae bacterium]|nr:CPBP family intramembrane metalloprotease [Oligoflexus sp.]